jgi:predicted aspartyl protease
MKPLFITILVFIISLNVNAQLNLNKGSVSPKKYYQEVDVEFVKNKLILPANIGGIHAKFILDTGAPLCISKQLQNQKNYKVIRVDSIIDANGKAHPTEIVEVDEISIGTLSYKNIPALVIDFKGTALECLKINGLIGSNLFRFGAIQIDWENQKVIITDSFKKLGLKRKDGARLLINTVQSSPYLTVDVDKGITDRLLVDTGSDDFYTFSIKGLEYVQSKGYLLDAVKYESKGCGSVGLFGPDTVGSNKLVKIDSITIGTMAHLHEFYTVTTNDDQSRIGIFLLKQGLTTIDFKKGLFFFKLYSNKFNYEYVSFGFEVINDKSQLKIGSVWKDSEACKKGIRVGDEIVNIEGLDVKKLNHCEVFLRFRKFIESRESIVVWVRTPNNESVKKIQLSRLDLD